MTPESISSPSSKFGPDFVKKMAIILGTIVISAIIYQLLPDTMSILARRTVVILVIAAVFWATEVLPLFATSLCVVALEILMLANKGGLAAKGLAPGVTDLSYKDFLAPFSSGIIILFMGGFLLSAAVTKHGLDKAIAGKLIKPFTKSPLLLLYGVLCITAFFSMWMSNTATAAMMIAIIPPIISKIPHKESFHRAIILAVPFGANIGGIGTPIGTPPNAVAMESLLDAGIKISFIGWMKIAVPLEIGLLAIVGILLYWFFKPKGKMVLEIAESTEKIDLQGKITLLVIFITIFLWLTTGILHKIDAAVVALLAAAILTALGVLKRRDVDSIDWNVLILMWGGLSLGTAMQSTGLVESIKQLPIASLSPALLAIAIVFISLLLSTFMSHTATANLIVPMAMAVATTTDAKISLVILTALSCSFAMAMPVSTPPNAIAFATGKIPVSAMIRSGGLISIIGVIALIVGYQIMLPLLLGSNGQ